MCKIAIIKSITDETRDKAWMFIKEMSKQMSKPFCTEDDGFGYAAIDNEGKLFGERWLNNDEAFQHRNPFGSEVDDKNLKEVKILTKEKVYNSFGNVTDNIRSVTLHSRMSTNIVALKNTHPFVEDFTSVIHNGVIHNHEKFFKKTSTCDSEVILHQYIKYNIMNRPGKIKKLANRLDGYYAMGIYSRTKDGTVIMDIIKDNSARLEAFFIEELQTIVFVTIGSIVEEACKKLGFKIKSRYDVKSNKLQRFNVMTGEVIAYESFKSKERVFTNYSNTDYTRYSGQPHSWPPVNNTDSRNLYPYGCGSNLESEIDRIVKTKEAQKDNNVIDMTTREKISPSKVKHDEQVKERLLEEMAMGNQHYSKEEVEQLINESIADLERFNNDDDLEWFMDDLFVWHKRTIA